MKRTPIWCLDPNGQAKDSYNELLHCVFNGDRSTHSEESKVGGLLLEATRLRCISPPCISYNFHALDLQNSYCQVRVSRVATWSDVLWQAA